MSFTTPTACSSTPQFSLKRYFKRGNKQAPKAKSGKPPPYRFYHKRQNDGYPKHDEHLHRLGPPLSPSSGTLLERIGGSAEDKMTLAMDQIDGECTPQGMDGCSDSSFSATPRFYTPEPGEVDRFLESVIGVPTAPELPSSAATCSGTKPALTLKTHNLPVDHPVKVEDPPSSVSYSPTRTAVNNLVPADSTLDHFYPQTPLLDDTMPPSSSTIQECRKHLVPVLLASAQIRSPANRLDSEQCLQLLSDDQCRNFFRQAKEMRSQLSSLVSQKTPVYQGRGRSLKRDRVDEVDTWVRNTHGRFGSMDTVVSEASRRDSDITLVDFTGGRLPPKAPRAMLQASQATSIKHPDSAQDRSYNTPRVTSPTVEDRPPGSTSLTELVRQAVQMFPALTTTSQPVAQTDASNAPTIQPTGDHSWHPTQTVSPIQSTSSNSTDFVTHLPTQPGLWFNQLGRRYAEIMDVDIEVDEEMFYLSGERQPSRLRMHLRLCSVRVGAVVESRNPDTPASLQDVNGAIERRAFQWPKIGTLVVQVNPESQRSKTWLPHTLKSDPLDVTSYMHPGKNTFRFIQLSDLSEFTFVLVASPPPPEEEWRSWDWASLVERSRTKPFSTMDNPTNSLSEFTHIPVTIRS